MTKEIRLIKKVKRLLRRLGMPRWLHHYGPKKYEFLDHLCALLMRLFSKLSYVRVVQLFELMGVKCPSKSALQYTAAKLDAAFWQRLLKATSNQAYLIAIDSTGLARANPSYYYLKRIDAKMPKVPIKVSVAIDTRTKKFCSAKIRVLPAHDSLDASFLLRSTRPKIAVLDKAYSSERLYEQAYEQKILLMIPQKKNAKRGFFRKKMLQQFKIRTYHRREMAESGISSFKRKYGTSVSSRTVRTIRTDVYGRLACHNIFLWLKRLLGWSLSHKNVYK